MPIIVLNIPKMIVLYEISTEPRSAFCNALEIINMDSRREVFLIDILNYIRREGLGIGWNYSYYVVVQDRLVYLDSPTCLVPPGSDGFIRMVFKPTSMPPVIHNTQYAEFADKSRIQLYSSEDYERTTSFAHRGFHEAARKAAHAPRLPSKSQSSRPPVAAPASNSGFGYSSGIANHDSAPSANFFHADFSSHPSPKYADSAQHDEFDAFDATFAPTVSRPDRRPESRPPPAQQSHQRQDSFSRKAEVSQREYRDEPSRYEDRHGERYENSYEDRPPQARFNYDHPHKSSHASNQRQNSIHSNNNDNNLNSIVGEDAAVVINDAVEAAGAAVKNFWGFASNLGKSVVDLANNASANVQSAGAGVMNSGTPGRLYAGQVVQVKHTLNYISFSLFSRDLFFVAGGPNGGDGGERTCRRWFRYGLSGGRWQHFCGQQRPTVRPQAASLPESRAGGGGAR